MLDVHIMVIMKNDIADLYKGGWLVLIWEGEGIVVWERALDFLHDTGYIDANG